MTEPEVQQLAYETMMQIKGLPDPHTLPGGKTQQMAMAQIAIHDAMMALYREYEVARMARDFWYTNYTTASVRAASTVDNVVAEAIKTDFHNDPQCAVKLKRVQAQITAKLMAYYIQPTKSGFTSVPGSLMATVAAG